MTPVSRTEILPEQQKPLEALRASIEADTDTKVQETAAPLQEAIDRNDRSVVMTALRTLESRLESLAAVERHREKLREAKYAVGFAMDDVDTALTGAADITKRTVVDPVVELARNTIPGAPAAMDAMQPTVDSVRDAYAKLPTAMRLPILGAVMAGGSWLASFPVKWMGKLVGLVSSRGQSAMETFAERMKSAGKIALVGGGILGAASTVTNLHREGAFDGAIERLKSK